MPAAIPVPGFFRVHQPHVRLVDQCRGLERLARFFMSHFFECEPPQFLIDQRQQLLGGMLVAVLDGTQDSRDLAHDVQDSGRGDDGQIRAVESVQSSITRALLRQRRGVPDPYGHVQEGANQAVAIGAERKTGNLSVCPFSVRVSCPLVRSQSFTVPPKMAVATRLPSGLNSIR